MQLVGSDQLLGLLRDAALGIGRKQLGRDGRSGHVTQHLRRAPFGAVRGIPFDDMTHERLGHRGVDPVHRHLVAVVGRPTQRQFRQVTRTHDQRSLAVGHVHQNLRPFAGLRILVGRRTVVGRQPDVAEVLLAGGADRNLACRDTQLAHQRQGIAIGAVGRPEPRHRDPHDPPPVESQPIEGVYRDEQRQRRIQPARNPHHRPCGVRMLQTAGQSHRLNMENLLAAAVPPIVLSRHERLRLDRTVERPLFGDGHRRRGCHTAARTAVPERRRPAAIVAQQLAVDVGHDELFAERKPLRRRQHHTILGHQRMTGEDQIGRRLAEPRRAVEVGRARASRLLCDQLPHIIALADRLGRRREVQEHFGAGRRQRRRRRRGNPQILADLHTAPRAVDVEQQVGAERHALPAQLDLDRRPPFARSEPA